MNTSHSSQLFWRRHLTYVRKTCSNKQIVSPIKCKLDFHVYFLRNLNFLLHLICMNKYFFLLYWKKSSWIPGNNQQKLWILYGIFKCNMTLYKRSKKKKNNEWFKKNLCQQTIATQFSLEWSMNADEFVNPFSLKLNPEEKIVRSVYMHNYRLVERVHSLQPYFILFSFHLNKNMKKISLRNFVIVIFSIQSRQNKKTSAHTCIEMVGEVESHAIIHSHYVCTAINNFQLSCNAMPFIANAVA